MTFIEPVAIIPQFVRNICPICGKATYSRGGIHPQCAMQKADEPRMIRLRAARRAEVKLEKPRQRSWNKKCPKCAAQIHVRREGCDCGFKFGSR